MCSRGGRAGAPPAPPHTGPAPTSSLYSFTVTADSSNIQVHGQHNLFRGMEFWSYLLCPVVTLSLIYLDEASNLSLSFSFGHKMMFSISMAWVCRSIRSWAAVLSHCLSPPELQNRICRRESGVVSLLCCARCVRRVQR